ncbi:hypothetical protein [Herbaspirillum rhizosphaerae]|uniref:hypothetical protein n=1 Tax=Herbaspirillum rhizosphaerae TaxID=346179 RepID=UPI00067B6157|nr:hypothetical protein [Herbaspirillum rhizosphaerae]
MKIDASDNPQGVASQVSASVNKASAPNDSQAPASTDTVTLSDAATQLASGLSTLAAAVAAMPLPAQPQPQAMKRRKAQGNGLTPMLDVDAFRLIRDKLRSQNLGLKPADPTVKKLKDAAQDDGKISSQ